MAGISPAMTGRFHPVSPSAVDRRGMGVERLEASEQGRVVVRGRLDLAGDPAEEIAVCDLDQAFELGNVLFRELPDLSIGKASHDQVHLPHAPVPGTIQDLPAANIKAGAAACRSAHDNAPI